MIGVAGVRGIAGETFTPEIATRFASAFGAFRPRKKVAIGRDTRPSGKMLRDAVVQGLLDSGCETIDLGICLTPSLLLNVKELKTSGGIAITASHNPMEWNGLKFINQEGLFLNPEEGKALKELFQSDSEIRYPKPVETQRVVEDDRAMERHIDKITSLRLLEVNGLHWRKFKVVVDCCNGAGSIGIPQFLKQLGCDVKKIHCSPQKPFPRNPETTRESLKKLSERVLQEEADLGFAVDPDGDRLSVVSEDGISLGEERTLVLVAKFILSKRKGTVVTNLSTTQAVEDVVRQLGGEVFRTRVGEVHVVSKMIETQAILGGEGNGGVIYPEVHLTRDSLVGMALILQQLLEQERPLSSIASSLPKYTMLKRSFPYPREGLEPHLRSIQDQFPNGEVDLLDGIRVNNGDSWFHIRASNTEPIVRVICEARSEKDAERLITTLQKLVKW